MIPKEFSAAMVWSVFPEQQILPLFSGDAAEFAE
jgi:hypothetical protein